MHKHSFKQTGGGCMVRGGEKYPCDIDYECECREKFTLLTTPNGFTHLPERFTTQPKSETHQETLNSINEAVIGGELSMTPESRPPFKDLADFVAAPPEKKEEAMLKVARAATNDQRAQIGLPPLQEETECCEENHCEYCASVGSVEGIEKEFRALTEKTAEGCDEWRGTVSSRGYGVFTHNGRQWKAHRIAKALAGDFVPHWLVIDHLCRNRACVRPSHLRLCTNAENVMAGEGPTAENAAKTACVNGHPYTEENTYYHKSRKGSGQSMWRQCKECVRIRDAARESHHKPRTPLPRKGPNAARFVKGLEKIAQRNLYPQSEAEKPNQ